MSSSRLPSRRLASCLATPLLLLAALGASARLGPGAGAPVAAQTGPAPAASPQRVASWEPLAVPGLGLPEAEGAATLAADGAELWLATETRVARYREGRWLAPESPEGVTRIFALAPTGGGGLWAFGFEGGAWRRDRQGRWRAQTAPTIADLYDAVAEDTAAGEAGRVWAVGYDYEETVGVLLRWDGAAFQVEAPESLRYRRLESVAQAPDGSLWAGGCDVGEPPQPPLLLRRTPGAEAWEEVALPLESGCVRDLSFADDGSGLAAAGTDLLAWDGAGWTALGLAPPTDAEGAALSWVRAATHTAGVGPDGPYRARWALAGVPTWRGYEDAAPPRVLEDGVWREVTPDDHGLADLLDEAGVTEPARPYLDLATDGARAWTFTAEPPVFGEREGFAALFSLEAGTGRLEHPLFSYGLQPVSDVALRPEAPRAEVWASPYNASQPLRRREEGRWEAGADYVMVSDKARLAMDVAGEAAAWAQRWSRDVQVQGPTEALRWDGQSWVRADAPVRVTQLRALPDGGAWARIGRSGQMLRWRAPEGWAAFPEAPAVAAFPRCQTELGLPLDCDALMAPFDVRRGPDGREEGWLADDQGRLQRWDGSAFRPEGRARGRVLDLALTETGGWAISLDAAGRDEVRGSLLRLREGRWREIPALSGIGDRPIEDLRWNLMSPVSDDAVWLTGVIRQGRVELAVLLSLEVADEGPRTRVVARELYMDCAPQAIAAAPLPEGGSELLMAGFPSLDRGACRHLRLEARRPAWTALAPRPQPWLSTGPVSRIVERPARGRLALPWLGR